MHTKVTEILGIRYPIIQAGMAGGVTTPELVAAVSNAGGLGTLGAGYMTPEDMRKAIREIRNLTSKPFAVNLFIPEPIGKPDEGMDFKTVLQMYYDELGIPLPNVTKYSESFDAQFQVILEEKIAILSFTFGVLPEQYIQNCKMNRIRMIGTATTVQEALALEKSGVDLIVGQGSEAGGHRGTFLGEFEKACIGTMALIPQMVDQVHIPVIAAGGIMDGRAIAASIALGAAGVQMGTAFLTCLESGAHPLHKDAVLNGEETETTISRVFSGKPARGITNRFIEEMQQYESHLPEYPVLNAWTRGIRNAAAKQNKKEFFSLWSGQAPRLSSDKAAKDLMQHLVSQYLDVIQNLNHTK